MAWLITVLTYGVIAVATLWVHVRYFFTVTKGFCEIKLRKMRIGKSRYAAVSAGTNFAIPFIQRRLPDTVFPVALGPGGSVATGRVTGATRAGRTCLVAEVKFKYYVNDVSAFMRNEYYFQSTPIGLATDHGRDLVTAAISEIREECGERTPRVLARILDAACKTHNRNSEIHLQSPHVIRVWEMSEISVVNPTPKSKDTQ